MVGTYPQYNWPRNSLYCKIYEANIGVKISKSIIYGLIWGLCHHILVSKVLLERLYIIDQGILADNSPYYEAVKKLAILQKMKNGIWRDVFKRLATNPEN
jgi:hypothetical protein